MSKRNPILFAIGSIGLLLGQQGFGDFYVLTADNRDIELTEQERNELAKVSVGLVENPSAALLESINTGDGIALIKDQREEPGTSHDLRMDITYTESVVDGHTKTEPQIMCEGSFNPVSLDYCRESSMSSLKLPGYDYVRINDDPITIDEIAAMFAYLDSQALQSTTGAAITSHGVHHALLNSRTGLYHLIGSNSRGEQFFIYLRAVNDAHGAIYELTDWSCQ